jgi:hypothetical protein
MVEPPESDQLHLRFNIVDSQNEHGGSIVVQTRNTGPTTPERNNVVLRAGGPGTLIQSAHLWLAQGGGLAQVFLTHCIASFCPQHLR